ncbi:MAG TPA: family 14 glycosylhydrolase [Bacillota bacterium]|nr:family 14 glycosylhydrolase [Bacillota bacterium]
MNKNRIFKTISLITLLILVFSITSWGCSPTLPAFSANVMAPLHVMNYNDPNQLESSDWQSFETELGIAKSMGVDAVSVDVWWGDVEALGDNQFNWSYYKEVFQKIKNAGLRIVPIVSLHQCGGNVGDTYTSLLPAWMWDAIRGNRSINDLKYQSELGNYSNEYVSLWADNYVLPQYKEFMEAFAGFCVGNGFAGELDEINISCGPAGELRYPSYNGHDWIYDSTTGSGFYEKTDSAGNVVLKGDRTNWPHRGAVQWYGQLALEDFKTKMKSKYGSLSKLKAAWGADGQHLNSFAAILFPNQGTDHGYPDGKVFKADHLFQSGAYYNTQYGRDLIEWYNQSLIDHGKRLLNLAKNVFDGFKFRRVPLGIKIPGIHWQMGTLGASQPVVSRAAEIAAGLIRPGQNFAKSYDLGRELPNNGHGYSEIISLCKIPDRKVNLHFTCLEMGNSETGGAGETPNQYSLAKTLVGWVATEAYRQGVTLKGENALSGGLPWTNEDFPGDWVDAWDHINQALERYSYSGITILRMTDVTTVQNPDNGKTVGQNQYRELISKFKQHPVTYDNVTVYYQGSAAQPKRPYRLLIWNQNVLTEYPMMYDGFHDNGHWWKVTVPAPNYFRFSFSEQPLKKRVYTRYPNNDNRVGPLNTIYNRAGDPVVYYQGFPGGF